ncbi:hypothetical protein [Coleofasciculus sp. E2-BRE-01]|uniref:hypothetical protein n=1 Tax=Coleofasciculus sp. E2-BRE-01 TaxID=3069524 RepID=UPI0033024FF8
MRGLFLPWLSGYSVVTGLDFLVHDDWLTILSYSLAWIVFLTYCFQPNYISLCAIFFSIIIPLSYLRLWILVEIGYQGNPYDIFDGFRGGGVDFRFTPEPGFWATFMGMGLILIGVFIGMNTQNRIIYLITIGIIIGLFSLFIGLVYLLN